MKKLIAILLFLVHLSILAQSGKVTSNLKQETKETSHKNVDSVKISKSKIEDKNLNIYLKSNNTNNTFKDILPFLTLLLGIFINRGIGYMTDRKRIKKHGERWKVELNSLETPIEKQTKVIETFLTEHKKETFEIPQMSVYSALNCTSFDSLDKAELIKYLEKFKSKKYDDAIKTSNKIQGFIIVQKSIFEILNTKFNEYLKEISTHSLNFNNSLQELHRSVADYGAQIDLETGQSSVNDERLKPILELFDKEIIPFHETGKYDLYVLEKAFYKPLMLLLVKLRHDDRAKPIISFARQGMLSINYLKNEKHYLQVNLQTVVNRYSEQSEELTKVLLELK